MPKSFNEWFKPIWKILKYIVFIVIPLIGVVVFLAGKVELRWICWISIVTIDLYLLTILFQATRSSDWKHNKRGTETDNYIMPYRTPAMFILIGFMIANIANFALIYLHSGMEVAKGKQEARAQVAAGQSITVKDTAHYTNNFSTRSEAAYFSFATMLTLGYGDTAPVSATVKRHVIFQLISAFLLFFGAFPLFISRISDYSHNKESMFKQLTDQGITITASYKPGDDAMKDIIQLRILELAKQKKDKAAIQQALRDEGFTKPDTKAQHDEYIDKVQEYLKTNS